MDEPEQEPVLDDADMLLIRRSHVKRAITCLNTAENADLRLVLRDLFALLKTPPAPVQHAYGQKPDAFALRTKKHGLEFNSGYGMVKTLEQAQEMQRRHMGNLEIVELRAIPPAAQRTWVGLTKGDIAGFAIQHGDSINFESDFAYAIERCLKGKNT
jgi:hypothetical protein